MFPSSVLCLIDILNKIIFPNNDTPSQQPNIAEVYEEDHKFVSLSFEKIQSLCLSLTVLWLKVRSQ